MSLLIEKQEEGEEEENEQQCMEVVPVCAANFSTTVVDTAYYIDEIHYKIGSRLYIENAD
jgi:hypothetical protein